MKKAIALTVSLLLAVNLCAACAKADTNSTETSVESSQTKRVKQVPVAVQQPAEVQAST